MSLVTSSPTNQGRTTKPRPACQSIRFPAGANVAQALDHNSKAVHRAYAKHAEVTVPSLDDWEKDWQENPQRNAQPKLQPVNFRSPLVANAQSN
jgi:hypothetical protein